MPLTLKLFRKPDPVLTDDEIDHILELVKKHRDWAGAEMDKGPVSESVLRTHMYSESVLEKLGQVRRSRSY